jgi:hypothetical protein
MANNLLAWLDDGTRVIDPGSCGQGTAACDASYLLTSTSAAAYLGTLLLLAVGVSVVAFGRRDVR